MKDISNKTLVFLLLTAIVLSLGGTFVSLQRLNLVARSGVTGLASGNETGTATLDIGSYNSLVIVISSLDMGTCTPAATNGTWVNTTDATAYCTNANEALLNLTVQNDGNSNVNVTIKSNISQTNFFGGGTSPQFQFMTTNTSSRAGCFHNWRSNLSNNNWWTNFAANGTPYRGCDNLTFANSADELVAEFEWFIPSDAPNLGDRVALITFEANALS